MGKLILIAGENGSCKSRYAEELISQTEGDRFYIATMEPCTEDNRRRVEKHRLQRAGLGFQTLELPTDVGKAPVTADSVVLLEDVSNLWGNSSVEKHRSVEQVLGDIRQLQSRCGLLVCVTIDGLSPNGYDEETAAYIDGLNTLNLQLYNLSRIAVRMTPGGPRWEKGSIHDLA